MRFWPRERDGWKGIICVEKKASNCSDERFVSGYLSVPQLLCNAEHIKLNEYENNNASKQFFYCLAHL